MYICILFLPDQWKNCTKLIQLFLFHFLLRALSANTPYHPIIKKVLKEKERIVTWACLFLPCYHFQRSIRLIQGSHTSKKGCNHWSFLFLRMPLPSTCVLQKSWHEQKGWPLGTVSPSIPTCTSYLALLTELLCMGLHWNSLPVGHGKCCMLIG